MSMITASFIALTLAVTSPPREPDGGGPAPRVGIDYDAELPQPLAPLLRKTSGQPLELAFPLRAHTNSKAIAVHGIANFVDQLDAFDAIEDYNCGQRTYDSDNYNHDAIDFFTWPFGWWQQENDETAVVAAAPGVVTRKRDGNPDKSCDFTDQSARANYVELQHDDGTVTRYLHMKNGSLTKKSIGERIESGEYLGIVGSSGRSSGPHLHFAIYENNQAVEARNGACNATATDITWIDEPPYYDSGLNLLATHDAPPDFRTCPETEIVNLSNRFEPGDVVYSAVYLRDQRQGQVIQYEIRDPNDHVFQQWTSSLNNVDHYAASYWYWGDQLPNDAPEGTWVFEVTYVGQTHQHAFEVGDSEEPQFEAAPSSAKFAGLWFDVSRSGEGLNIIPSPAGVLVYYFGSDREGNRLWLASELLQANLTSEQTYDLRLFDSSGGNFTAPIAPKRGLSEWGTISLSFTSCQSGSALLTGKDGELFMELSKLSGVAGSGCEQSDMDLDKATSLSGLWFDPEVPGDGFNIVESGAGSTLFYYGFDERGYRLWLISDTFVAPDSGETTGIPLFKLADGVFGTPDVESLETWGEATLHRSSCSSMQITLDGQTGLRDIPGQSLVGIAGLECSTE